MIILKKISLLILLIMVFFATNNAYCNSNMHLVTVGIASNDVGILQSQNGEGWSSSVTSTNPFLLNVIWTGSQWIAVGYNGAVPAIPVVLTSPMGRVWSSQKVPAGVGAVFGVAGNSNQQIAVADSDKINKIAILKSCNGENWILENHPELKDISALFGVAWNGSKWLAVGYDFGTYKGRNGVILQSDDGIHWNIVIRPDAEMLLYAAWSGESWAVVGVDKNDKGVIFTSQDGVNWQSAQLPADVGCLYSVAWNGERWVAVGLSGYKLGAVVLTSIDGINWDKHEISTAVASCLFGISWSGDKWIAVGVDQTLSKGVVLTSSAQANDWILQPIPAGPVDLEAVAWDGKA